MYTGGNGWTRNIMRGSLKKKKLSDKLDVNSQSYTRIWA